MTEKQTTLYGYVIEAEDRIVASYSQYASMGAVECGLTQTVMIGLKTAGKLAALT
jgi:hypothetical protein